MAKKSKYYYDYTRNMSDDQITNKCGRPVCNKELCDCKEFESMDIDKWRESLKKHNAKAFDSWVTDMAESDQPTCNIENGEDCENCGS